MKERYIIPTAEVVLFAEEDIITTSSPADPSQGEVELPFDDLGK